MAGRSQKAPLRLLTTLPANHFCRPPLPQPVRPVDPPELGQGAYEVAAFDLRAFHVVPGGDGELVDRAGGGVTAPAFDEAGDDLHVEDPAGEEWLGEDVAQVAAGAEELGPALRVVDR